MKIFAISDDSDLLTGLRLAGIAGRLADSPETFALAFEAACRDESIGIIAVSETFAAYIESGPGGRPRTTEGGPGDRPRTAEGVRPYLVVCIPGKGAAL